MTAPRSIRDILKQEYFRQQPRTTIICDPVDAHQRLDFRRLYVQPSLVVSRYLVRGPLRLVVDLDRELIRRPEDGSQICHRTQSIGTCAPKTGHAIDALLAGPALLDANFHVWSEIKFTPL